MKLIVTRHGRTPDNVQELSSGQNDTLMDEIGCFQVVELGIRLKGLGVQKMFASDLPRIRQCIKIIDPDCPVEYCPVLRERHFGILDKRSCVAYQEAFASSGADRMSFRPPGGESYLDVAARVEQFIVQVLEAEREYSIIAVLAHGNINRVLLANLLGKDLSQLHQDPASVSILEHSDGAWFEHILNDTQHLQREPKSPSHLLP
jgi:broad specificity phosphatase PhoE